MIFEKEIDEIYRLKIPFENLYTSVFLIKNENKNILVDCATTAQDVDDRIVFALEQIKLSLDDIYCLILTHNHRDHSGGKTRILQRNPKIKIIYGRGENISNKITTYALKGHTLDCIGLLEECSGTLIAGDGLQGAGVGRYRCSLENQEEYIKTILKIKQDKRISNILFSHAYEPWYKDGVFGRREVEKILKDCIYYANNEN